MGLSGECLVLSLYIFKDPPPCKPDAASQRVLPLIKMKQNKSFVLLSLTFRLVHSKETVPSVRHISPVESAVFSDTCSRVENRQQQDSGSIVMVPSIEKLADKCFVAVQYANAQIVDAFDFRNT